MSVHEIGCQIRLICQWFKDMCTNRQHIMIIYTANEHAQFCDIARLIHWSMASIIFFQGIKPRGVGQSPSQLVSLTAHSHLSGLMVKPFLRSQRKMVANSLMWWFQSLEKAPTSLYVWLHNIIWIHVIWILIMWIHVIGIHIYHRNSSSIFWQYISIIAWAMSGEHLSPIESHKYLYLPNGVMMVQESWLLLSSSNV